MQEEFITIPEAAGALGVCERTVRRAILDKKLKAYKRSHAGGFRYWLRPHEVEEYHQRMRTIEPTRA